MTKNLKTPMAEEEWRDNFRNKSLTCGFSVVLSKTMLEYLCACADDVVWDKGLYWNKGGGPENWIATECCLTKRGLIERKSREEIDANSHLDGRQCLCRLTPAGELVVALIQMAGVFVEADAAIEKKSKRA